MTEDKHIRELLDDHSAGLDGNTRAKLHQARNRALDGDRRTTATFGWAGAGAVAASLALAVVYFEPAPPPLPTIYEDPTQQAIAEDIELMDDLEFYAWLVLEEDEAVERVDNT